MTDVYMLMGVFVRGPYGNACCATYGKSGMRRNTECSPSNTVVLGGLRNEAARRGSWGGRSHDQGPFPRHRHPAGAVPSVRREQAKSGRRGSVECITISQLMSATEDDMGIQGDWASCPKCQGLHFAGFPNFKGVCPAGGQHEQTGSFAYGVEFDVPARDGLQLGWASCPKCQGLHFAGFPNFKGVCPAGGQHEQTGSFAYATAVLKPAIRGTESPQGGGLLISGTGFTRNRQVRIVFNFREDSSFGQSEAGPFEADITGSIVNEFVPLRNTMFNVNVEAEDLSTHLFSDAIGPFRPSV